MIFPLHNIAEKLGSVRAMTLFFSRAFIGCDTVSIVSNLFDIGKRTLWETWAIMTHMTAVLIN